MTAFGSEGITDLGTEAVTITDTTVDAGDLNILNNYTTGVINADSLTKLTGTIADVNVAFAADAASSATISGLGDQAVELTDTNVLAADLNTLNGYTTGDIDASTVAVIEGTVTALNTAYDTAGINGLGNEAVTITDTTAAVADLVTLDGNTSGVIDASAAHTLSGTVSNANSVYASDGFTGLGAEAVTLTDTSLADVADLNTLNGYTTGNIDASEITSLTGSISDLNTAYAAGSALGNGISGLGNETVTIDDTASIDASALNTLNGYTTGNVDATTAESFTGTISDLNTLYAAAASSGDGIKGLGSEAVTVTDSSVSASDLNTLNTNTDYNITVNATAISGSLSDVSTLYGNKAGDSNADTDGFTGLGAEAITITDTGSIAASTLLTVAQANSSGTVDASNAGTITGTAAEIIDAYDDSTITEASDVALTVNTANSGTATLTQARSLDGLTTGVVTATIAATDLSDLLDDSTPLLDANGNNAFTITIGSGDARYQQQISIL